MKHFYIITDLDKEYVQKIQVLIKAYLEAKGAEYLLHHIPERIRRTAHIDGAQVPEDTKCVITAEGDSTLIQAARDLAGRNIPMLGMSRGHLGYLNQVSHQEDIASIPESLLNEHYQLERWMMIHGIAWWGEETLLKDIALNEVAITRGDPLKAFHYSVYVNDEYLDEYAVGGVLVATPTGPTAYNLSTGEPVIAPRARMMALTPICPRSLNARSIMSTPEDRAKIKVLNSGQVASFDGDMSVELKTRDCIDIRRSRLQAAMIKVKQISFIRNLGSHLGGIQTLGPTRHYKSTGREASHMKVRHHNKIVGLIGKYEIEIQEELVERLSETGFNVTQATVSRDIREPKLIKVQLENGRQCYMVLESPRGTSVIRYIRILKDGYMSMDMAQNILVIKTVSDMATTVAIAPDVIQSHEVVGCIVGDDTIMCIIHSVDDTIVVMERIKKIVEDQRKRGAICHRNCI